MLRTMFLSAGLIVFGLSAAYAADPKTATTDPTKADADFAIQGEYASDGEKKFGAQVIALGDGKFDMVVYVGGLPGAGWKAGDKKEKATGETKDGATHFTCDKGTGVIKNGALTLTVKENGETIALKRVERKSPTLGAKPPEGAIVLFDGSNVDNFQNGRLTEDKLLQQGVTSKQKFQSCTLHVEFQTPYQPYARGQGRGNSGCYLQGRYEVQVLDSFGLEGKDNEAGGVYSIKSPDLNMCLPPLAWQTYDIDYTAATFDENKKKTANAKITVRHNGVVVHENLELPKATTAAPVPEGPEPGPVYLQDHGNPVRYRNIWLLEKK
jgi:hypothetical protein